VDVANRGASLALALEPVFVYIEMANSSDFVVTANDDLGKRKPTLGAQFGQRFAQLSDIGSAVDAVIRRDPAAAAMEMQASAEEEAEAAAKASAKSGGIFSRIFGGGGGGDKARRKSGTTGTLDVEDFELLKVVGKGAFGKVMLVRRKDGPHMGEVYAMKVLKKSVVAAKNQVEHTQAERKILAEIKHPFLVQLRYAFQSEEKLYLITDYYNGGSLYYHLRRAKSFSHPRTRFYAAQLAMALAHLHTLKIIYRDLKLENILMHSSGNIALTDFGLSKQGVDENANTQTFCGTAEYIAPDLLEDKPYGPVVDWWSFGILIFEMLTGKVCVSLWCTCTSASSTVVQ
jgi:tRNA A-37 threonylcarbamoyl transferase component Bud32